MDIPATRKHARATNEALLESYERLGNVHLVGKELGLHGSSVHERLVRLDRQKKVRVFTPSETAFLKANYEKFVSVPGGLTALAKQMNRTKPFICRMAGKLGLTDQSRSKVAANRPAAVTTHSRGKGGYRDDLGSIYFRSTWEANYARYLNMLVRMRVVQTWEFEPETFWFLKIKRGVRSYLPDFKVYYVGEEKPTYVEVKGWMDATSKTKIRRFNKYYPQHRLEVVATKEYRAIKVKWSSSIAGWE